MATIKSQTDLQQSKKLAEILPLESADMHFVNDKHAGCVPYLEMTKGSNPWLKGTNISPCWSLSALLNVLPSATLDSSNNHRYRLYCMEKFTEWHDNPIDACVAMIGRLHKLKML